MIDESGIVLAVPAIVQETSKTEKPIGTFLEGQEYENLVTSNQYYEQVQFVGGKQLAEERRLEMQKKLQKEEEEEEGLYSIPQPSSMNSSTEGLTRSSSQV